MSATSSQSEKRCPICDSVISSDGLCAACLLRQAAIDSIAFDTEPTADSEVSTELPTVESVAAAFPQLEIIEMIGRGGMGTVFKARQPKLNRFVALKILTSPTSSSSFTERFLREAQLLARLSHPNIVTVHDFGQAGGFYYLMMEFVDGVNLRQAIRSDRFTPEQTLSIVPKICEALQYAHEEGVLHRDIKPENILLDTKGRVKIADFGIAGVIAAKSATTGRSSLDSVVTDDEKLTQAGQILGTPNYMAPEQIETPSEVDHRADIYSLGVVFYELLTGELPKGRFPLPSEKTLVGADVDRIVLKALEKERDKRQQSASELKTEVETVTNAQKNESPMAPTIPPSPPKRSRRGCLGCLGLLAIGVLVGMLVLVIGLSAVGIHVEQEGQTVDLGPGGIHVVKPSGKTVKVGPGGIHVVEPNGQTVNLDPGGFRINSSQGARSMFMVPIGLLLFLVLIVGVIVLIFVLVKQAGTSNELRTPSMPTKFCTHCGAEQVEGASACPKCGYATRQKREYCFNCGAKTDPEQVLCIKCGASLTPSPLAAIPGLGGRKDKLVTGLLALLLGWIGIHKFYLESWGWGVVYVLLSWTGIPFIAGIIEGILFLTMDEQTFDQRYNQTQPGPFRW